MRFFRKPNRAKADEVPARKVRADRCAVCSYDFSAAPRNDSPIPQIAAKGLVCLSCGRTYCEPCALDVAMKCRCGGRLSVSEA